MDTNSFELGGFSEEQRALLASFLDQEDAKLETDEIRPRIDPTDYPLSAGQRRLWFLDHLEGGGHYNENLSVRIQGKLDYGVVASALQEIFRRHQVMRSTFVVVNGEPVQRIAPLRAVDLPVIDLRGIPEPQREAEATRLAVEEARRPFELEKGPLWRFKILSLAECDSILLVITHHVAMDGWSAGIFWNEFGALYEAFRAGQPSPLPEPTIQYADYAVWQAKWQESEAAARQLAYWTRQLEGTPPLLELPADRPRPPIQMFQGACHFFTLPQALVAALKALSRSEEATFFMTLLGALQVLIARYTEKDNISIGTPIANRSHAEIEGLIGFFVNTLVLRGDLSGNPTFRELLGRIRRTTLEAYENQDLPFEKFVGTVRAERTQAYSPLFQVLLIHQNTPKPSFDVPGLLVSAFRFDFGISKFDLTLAVREEPDGLACMFEYNSDLFNADRVERMAEHLEVLLTGIVASPELPLSELPLLTERERRQLLLEWNATKSEYPAGACIHELFEAQARNAPDAVAVEFNDARLTYSELNQRSNQFARRLQALGVTPNVPVAVYVERSLEMVIALLGILKAGSAYLPLDLSFPADRIAFMLEDAQPRVLVTLEKLKAKLPPHTAEVICVDEVGIEESGDQALASAGSQNLAYIIYTSGSTGKPKGVEICHRSVVNFLTSMRREPGLTAQDVVVSVTTPSFDIFGLELWLTLTTGAKVVLVSPETARDGAQMKALLQRCAATLMQATPSTWRLLLEAGWEGDPNLKILCGGEAWSLQLAEQLLPRCSSLWNMYGPTETTIWSAVFPVVQGGRMLLGRPIANTQFYVVDAHLQLVPVGVPGELLISGDGVARGYWNRPELTASKFIADRFTGQADSRLYRTGDLVRYLPDGNLEFLGRIDQQVKIRGFRIELEEIETVLLTHPGVRQAVVVVREEGEKYLAAYVVPAEGSSFTTSELRDHLKQSLPDYMVPTAWVSLPVLPLTPNGKLDRKALPAPTAEAAPPLNGAYVSPDNETEQQVAAIWQDVLGVARVGRDDNFFDLGGHSLLMVRVNSRLKDAFQKDISMVDMFGFTTVRTLANYLTGGDATMDDGVQTVPVQTQDGARKQTLRRRQVWRHLASESVQEPLNQQSNN
jgi:amino acid adenylation domain-containing protein